jgi:hypothetical protein
VPGWAYGEEGAAYPVSAGETWQLGRHTFICASLLRLTSVSADVFYADPPWNNAILRMFERNTPGAAEVPGGYRALYDSILRLAAGRPCFIEGSVRQAADVQQLLGWQGGLVLKQWPITYARYSRRCVLHYAGPPVAAIYADPSGLDDSETPGWVLSRFPRGLVCDLTAGRGLTAILAEKAGWSSVNVELDPRRVSAAMARLGKLVTGYAPARVAA